MPTPTRLYIKQGATLRHAIQFIPDGAITPTDWTGYTARMQVRAGINSATVYLGLTTENSGISINGPIVTLTATNVQTMAYNFGSQNQGVYDIEMVSPAGKVTKLCYGVVELKRAITK